MKTINGISVIIAGLILLILTNQLFSQQKETIAVVCIETTGIISDTFTVLNMTRLQLEKSGFYKLLDQRDISDALKANNIDAGKCHGNICLLEVGKFLKSDKLLTGSVERFGEKIVIIYRLIDVQSKSVVKYDVMEYFNHEPELQSMIEISVNNILEIENDKELVDMLVNYSRQDSSSKTIVKINGKRIGIDFKHNKFWLDAGIGGYFVTGSSYSGLTQNYSANLTNDSTIKKVRFLFHNELWLFGPEPGEEFYNISILIGKGFSDKYFQIQFSFGLGLTGGLKRGKLLYKDPNPDNWLTDSRHYEIDNFITPSIPLEIDFLIKPIKYFGFGVTLFGDLNFEKPMGGIILKFGMGKLR